METRDYSGIARDGNRGTVSNIEIYYIKNNILDTSDRARFGKNHRTETTTAVLQLQPASCRLAAWNNHKK